MRFLSFLLLCIIGLLIVSPTLGQAATAATTSTINPTAMAKSFYCDTYNFLSSEVGVIIGLTLTAYGVFLLMTSGPGFGVFLIIFAGVFFTAIPTVFEGTLNTIGQIFGSVGGSAPGTTSSGC